MKERTTIAATRAVHELEIPHRQSFSSPALVHRFPSSLKQATGALCTVLTALALTGCADRQASPPASVTSRLILVMGTAATVSLPGHDVERLAAAADITEKVFQDYEQRLSLFREDSEMSSINRAAGRRPVIVSDETFAVITAALDYAHLSNGAFDPTVAPLVRIWGRGVEAPQVLPDHSMINRTMSLVGYRKVHADPGPLSIYLEQEGMSLDLGGIAKGVAADRAAAALAVAGYENFLIDLGGDIVCAGKPDGRPAWRIGVRDPFDTSRILGAISMYRLPATATSGNYERSVIIDGKRYGHLIDPRTGLPTHGMAGVTVLAPDAATADAMSTALFVGGMDQAVELLQRVSRIEALLVPDREPLEIWVTPGFQEHFEPEPENHKALKLLNLRDPNGVRQP